MNTAGRNHQEILGTPVALGNYSSVADQCVLWGRRRESRTVVFANVHVVMEAYDDPRFRKQLKAMDLVNPDGMPLVWALRALGGGQASRVYGPHATQHILRAAERAGLSVGFYGGSETTLGALVAHVRQTYSTLEIGFAVSPPFRALTEEEDEAMVRQITRSGVHLLFVGLGCPKQESWMSSHKAAIPAVLLGVGAAFDFLAATKPQAPGWMMRSGTEWLFRLCSEPRRLLGRYAKHNPRFVVLFLLQLLRRHRTQAEPPAPSQHPSVPPFKYGNDLQQHGSIPYEVDPELNR